MFNSLDKMKRACNDMLELRNDVDLGYFLPKRFRKMSVAGFINFERTKYVKYLDGEINDLDKRIKEAMNESK